MTERSDHDWKQLADEANTGMKGQGAVVEAMHRLTDRLDAFNASSDRYSKRMYWMNITLLLLTVVQAAPVVIDWIPWSWRWLRSTG